MLSFYNTVFGFWIPIVFALIVNEISRMKFRKLVQTASYLPYFISSVVVAGMVLSFIQPDDLVNNFLALFGVPRQSYNMNSAYFPFIYTFTNTGLW